MSITDFFTFMDGHEASVKLLFAAAGSLLTGFAVFAKEIFKFLYSLFSKSKTNETKETVVTVNNTIDVASLKDLFTQLVPAQVRPSAPISPTLTGSAGDPEVSLVAEAPTEEEVLKAGLVLSRFRKALAPKEELSPAVFPKQMNVLAFKPGERLKIILPTSAGEKGCMGLFSILHYTLLPGALGGGVDVLFGTINYHLFQALSVVLGWLIWFRLTRLGAYISINLRAQTYGVVSVTSGSWGRSRVEATTQSTFGNDIWTSSLLVSGYLVAVNTSTTSRDDAEAPFRPFLHSLNWAMKSKVEIAKGVYVTPQE